MADYSTDGDAALLEGAMSILAELRHRQRAASPKPVKAWDGRSRKLSDADIAGIRVQHRLGSSFADLAVMYDVCKPTITSVVRYRGAYK